MYVINIPLDVLRKKCAQTSAPEVDQQKITTVAAKKVSSMKPAGSTCSTALLHKSIADRSSMLKKLKKNCCEKYVHKKYAAY